FSFFPLPPPPTPLLFPYTTLFRSLDAGRPQRDELGGVPPGGDAADPRDRNGDARIASQRSHHVERDGLDRGAAVAAVGGATAHQDRKSTRLNSSHDQISYAVFCLK